MVIYYTQARSLVCVAKTIKQKKKRKSDRDNSAQCTIEFWGKASLMKRHSRWWGFNTFCWSQGYSLKTLALTTDMCKEVLRFGLQSDTADDGSRPSTARPSVAASRRRVYGGEVFSVKCPAWSVWDAAEFPLIQTLSSVTGFWFLRRPLLFRFSQRRRVFQVMWWLRDPTRKKRRPSLLPRRVGD